MASQCPVTSRCRVTSWNIVASRCHMTALCDVMVLLDDVTWRHTDTWDRYVMWLPDVTRHSDVIESRGSTCACDAPQTHRMWPAHWQNILCFPVIVSMIKTVQFLIVTFGNSLHTKHHLPLASRGHNKYQPRQQTVETSILYISITDFHTCVYAFLSVLTAISFYEKPPNLVLLSRQ